MPTFDHLVNGYKTFKATSYPQKKELVTHLLQQGLKPSTLVITSSALRIAPDELTSSNPGELFTVRNLGGLVPPYKHHAHGITSSIEYAITELNVSNVVVLGNADCYGIKKLMSYDANDDLTSSDDPLKNWLSIAKEARDIVKQQLSDQTEQAQEAACEKEAILISLRNLLSYPWIKERVEADTVRIYGWHFNIQTGELLNFNPANRHFEPIT